MSTKIRRGKTTKKPRPTRPVATKKRARPTRPVATKKRARPTVVATKKRTVADGKAAPTFGFYDDVAREYVVTDPRTPTKWVNYIGTLDFGGFVDQTGGLNICRKDPANNRITGYRIDTPQNAVRGNTLYCRIKNAK